MNIRSILKKYISGEIRNRIRYLLPSFLFKKSSYSQSGEDIIVSFLLDIFSGATPKKYLDVGANHPFHLSNTALLYKKGGHGILIEPDPYFAKLLRRKRPRDKVIECGVHFSGEPNTDFYVMDSPTLNTFSEQEMLRYVSMGHQLTKTLRVDLLDINCILESAGELDFLNLDIEGLDYAVLEKIDWKKHRPLCLCVETIAYEKDREPEKLTNIINLMHSNDYFLYADTFINSIFVDRHQWQSHWNQTKNN
jgi:FkbM family methyltransferase